MDASLSGRVAIVTGAGRDSDAAWRSGSRACATVMVRLIASDFDDLKPVDTSPGAFFRCTRTCADRPTAMRW